MAITNLQSVDKNNFQVQPFHLVSNSPWPLLSSFSAFNMVVGFTGYIHQTPYAGTASLLGLSCITLAMCLWFRDIVAEGTFLGDHTSQVRSGLNLGFSLFLVSEIFVFVSVFWAYLHSALAPTIDIGSSWPPVGIETLDPFALPLLNTVILLSSGAFVTWAHHALIKGDRVGSLIGNIITVLLAVFFTYLQAVEYSEAAFTISDSVYGTVFYAGTGLHGLHVLLGTILIFVASLRLYSYHFTNSHHLGYETAILYWHFVDVVWLGLYVLFYWWGC